MKYLVFYLRGVLIDLVTFCYYLNSSLWYWWLSGGERLGHEQLFL